jgi:hypothetical protein
VRRLLLLLLILLLICLLLFAAGVMDLGLFRWPVKTFRDRDRGRVWMKPLDTTVAALTRLPRPPNESFHGLTRIAPEELSVYRVRAKLRRILDGADGDIHLILVDPVEPSRTMIAEIPNPLFAVGSGLGRIFSAERTEVQRHPRAQGEMVEVTGIGFFDYYTTGHASNGFELHPVLGLKFLSPRSPVFDGSTPKPRGPAPDR